MADVFVGCMKGEAGFERVVAVKRMALALAEDEEFVAMFLHEARLAAHIRSAHVVQTLDLGRGADGTPYLVMDLVVGASVARLMRGAARRSLSVPPEVATGILVNACSGLQDAHDATGRDGSALGIVHRDVSPHNILVGEDGLAKVADFGIARALGTSGEVTRDPLRGKVAYFSPEQARGESLDRRSDVFSLGIVAWELLSGERLFCAEHPIHTLDRVLHAPIPRVDSIRDAVAPQLAAAVGRALERDPNDRYATAGDFETALRDAAQACGFQLHPSTVADFLATCCAEELRHIGVLLRARTSSVGEPPQVPPPEMPGMSTAQMSAQTKTELDPSTLSAETVTQPFRLQHDHEPPATPPARRPGGAQIVRHPVTRIALAVIALLGLALVVLGLWGKTDAPTQPRVVQSAVKGPPPPPSSRDLLRVGTTFFNSISSSHLAPALFWNIVESSSDGSVKASFVRQLPTLDNGSATILSGGKFEVRWQLLPSLRWSDGSPLRADDLVMSHRLVPNSHALEARATAEDTAVFVWSDRWANAVEGFEPFPASVYEPLIASGGREAAWEYRKTHATPGLGPYRVTEVQIGERMVMAANPYFAGPPPSIQRVELRCSKDTGRLVEQFERGELDLIVPNSITVEQAEDLKKRRPDAVHLRPSRHYVLLQPDITHPLLASVEARQALMMAIDRVALTQKVYGRTDLIAHCPVLGLGPGAVKTYSFEPKRAAAQMVQLKLAGTTLPLFHSTWAVDVQIAELLRDQLEAAGLGIELRPVERVSKLFREGRHGGLVLYSLRDFGPEVVAAHFNLPALGADFDRSVRHTGFDDWTASLLDREERAIDPLRRAQLKQELWRAFAKRLPLLPLAFLLERVVADPSLRGWEGNPSQRFGNDLERWYFVR
jgi:eukaryotic-like serine/threonine-protein kinase